AKSCSVVQGKPVQLAAHNGEHHARAGRAAQGYRLANGARGHAGAFQALHQGVRCPGCICSRKHGGGDPGGAPDRAPAGGGRYLSGCSASGPSSLMTSAGLHVLSVDEFYTRVTELWPETETRWKAGVEAEVDRFRELFGDGAGGIALDCTCGEGVQALALAR